MKKLIMFLPSINNGGNEKNFFSTANNLHKRKIKISIVTCSGNKAVKNLILKITVNYLILINLILK